ncbi:Receptor protein serine/threonine kinase [Trichostrongylus colubriformis]|uniref:receptor protein serine/threonine kinase n=1 Tax=Trichostrongylus colubriformis TaxID=6319 RepID=A0AAN8FBW2_TRICO
MIYDIFFVVIFLLEGISEVVPQGNQDMHCIYSRAGNLDDWEQLTDDIAEGGVNVTKGLSPIDPVSVRCVDSRAHCVAMWTVRENKTEMLLQGCWRFAQDDCSVSGLCSSSNRLFQPSRNGYPTYMCCCLWANCNHIDLVVVGPLRHQLSNQSIAKTTSEDFHLRDSRITILIWTSSLLSVLTLLLATRRWYQRQLRGQDESSDNMRRVSIIDEAFMPCQADSVNSQSGGKTSSEIEPLLEDHDPFLESLQIGERIGGGHFADVHRASSSMGDVAVKVYRSDQVIFDNEHDILASLQSLKHPNIVHLFSAVVSKKHLVLQLYAGSLQSLLEECSLSLSGFFDCATAVTDGLAFLHSNTNVESLNTVFFGGIPKEVIAHRDLNPYNILYCRQSGTRIQLCLADFGLSISFPGGRPARNLELLTERGTVRYMAVELLEGSVNLLDPMTSLLQADVYSCALVLWELLWRCKDIWPGGEIPSHRVAFDNLVPRNPRLEHMYPVVVRERRRPDVPPLIQKQKSMSNPSGLVEMWTFITDMWEQEPEGRTTAACSADRLRRLRRSLDPVGAEHDE